MKKSTNLNSQEWCDVIFKDKNKSYGAYEMRMSSSKRHIAALGITLLIVIAIIVLVFAMNKISGNAVEQSEELYESRISM